MLRLAELGGLFPGCENGEQLRIEVLLPPRAFGFHRIEMLHYDSVFHIELRGHPIHLFHRSASSSETRKPRHTCNRAIVLKGSARCFSKAWNS